MELQLAEAAFPVDGALVGYLVFTNTGADTCRVPGNLSLDTAGGDLTYELIRPDGESESLRYRSIGDRSYGFPARICPGGWAAAPVYLLRLRNEFIFRDTGEYRIRAVIAARIPYDLASQPAPPARQWISSWRAFRVTKPGPGHQLWKNTLGRDSVYQAFSNPKLASYFHERLDHFEAYRGEVAKFIILQECTPQMHQAMLWREKRTPDILNQVRDILQLSRDRGIATDLWDWILDVLESNTDAPCDWRGPQLCGGYTLSPQRRRHHGWR